MFKDPEFRGPAGWEKEEMGSELFLDFLQLEGLSLVPGGDLWADLKV